jgi:hypothetical protein
MIIHAYLLDIFSATLKPVTVDSANTLRDIYRHIGCSLVDIVAIGDRHVLYCDDEGLTEGLSGFTVLEGHPSPLAGNLLITGTNADGETTSVTGSIETIAALLTVVRPVLDPVFETIDGPNVFGSRVRSFRARLERQRPTIVALDEVCGAQTHAS